MHHGPLKCLVPYHNPEDLDLNTEVDFRDVVCENTNRVKVYQMVDIGNSGVDLHFMLNESHLSLFLVL
jgi:hypothetical protein